MSTAIGLDLLKQLAVLAQGRTPILAPQGWHYGGAGSLPTATNDGVDVDEAIWAEVGVILRASTASWRSFYRVDINDSGETYGVIYGNGSLTTTTVSGNAAGAAATIADLKTALEAEGNFTGAGGTCALVDGHIDTLAISFPAATPVIRAGSVSANESCAQEADRCLWRVWGLPLGLDRWTLLRDTPARLATQAGELATVLCAGYRRLYVEVVDSDGIAQLLVGPCRRDDQEAALLEDSAQLLTAAADGLYSFPTTASGGRYFRGAWTDEEVVVSTTATLLTRGGEYIEIKNQTGADLQLRIGGAAVSTSYLLPDGEAWWGEQVGAVYGILAAGSGTVIVQVRRV